MGKEKISFRQYCMENNNEDLIKQWNYKLNKDVTLDTYMVPNTKKVWWVCSSGHEWEMSINERLNKKSHCPICCNKLLLPGYNDLATKYPGIANEWHAEKNGDLKPTEVFSGSGKKVWWKCEKGHEWETTISHRTEKKATNCPVCAGKKLWLGYNDLGTCNPSLAAEWNYTKNLNITPYDVTNKANKKVWWVCNKGHEWKASISDRSETGCPICSNRIIIEGYNDLATINKELAHEWNYEKNIIKPTQVSIRCLVEVFKRT